VLCLHLFEKVVPHSRKARTRSYVNLEAYRDLVTLGQTLDCMLLYQILLVLRDVGNAGTEELHVQTVAACKKDYATRTSPQVRINKKAVRVPHDVTQQ